MIAHQLHTREEDDGSRRYVCDCGWNSHRTYWTSSVEAEAEALSHASRARQAEADQEFEQEREDNPALARAEAHSFGEGVSP